VYIAFVATIYHFIYLTILGDNIVYIAFVATICQFYLFNNIRRYHSVYCFCCNNLSLYLFNNIRRYHSVYFFVAIICHFYLFNNIRISKNVQSCPSPSHTHCKQNTVPFHPRTFQHPNTHITFISATLYISTPQHPLYIYICHSVHFNPPTPTLHLHLPLCTFQPTNPHITFISATLYISYCSLCTPVNISHCSVLTAYRLWRFIAEICSGVQGYVQLYILLHAYFGVYKLLQG
jgi:hypothetical protein